MVMLTCYCCNLCFCLEFAVQTSYLGTSNNSNLGLWWHSVITCFLSKKQIKTSRTWSNLMNNGQRTGQKWQSMKILGLRETLLKMSKSEQTTGIIIHYITHAIENKKNGIARHRAHGREANTTLRVMQSITHAMSLFSK